MLDWLIQLDTQDRGQPNILVPLILLFSYTKTFLHFIFFSYKVVVGLVDPVGNTVELHDLKPYTYYQLDLRDRNGQKLYASVNFSTAGQLKVYSKNIFYYVKGKRRYQLGTQSLKYQRL